MSTSLELPKVHSQVPSPRPKTHRITAHALSRVNARFHILPAMMLEIQSLLRCNDVSLAAVNFPI